MHVQGWASGSVRDDCARARPGVSTHQRNGPSAGGGADFSPSGGPRVHRDQLRRFPPAGGARPPRCARWRRRAPAAQRTDPDRVPSCANAPGRADAPETTVRLALPRPGVPTGSGAGKTRKAPGRRAPASKREGLSVRPGSSCHSPRHLKWVIFIPKMQTLSYSIHHPGLFCVRE